MCGAGGILRLLGTQFCLLEGASDVGEGDFLDDPGQAMGLLISQVRTPICDLPSSQG